MQLIREFPDKRLPFSKNATISFSSHLAVGGYTFGDLFGEAASKFGMLCVGLYRYVKLLDTELDETFGIYRTVKID